MSSTASTSPSGRYRAYARDAPTADGSSSTSSAKNPSACSA